MKKILAIMFLFLFTFGRWGWRLPPQPPRQNPWVIHTVDDSTGYGALEQAEDD